MRRAACAPLRCRKPELSIQLASQAELVVAPAAQSIAELIALNFRTSSFANLKALEEAEIKVAPAGKIECVAADSAVG